MRTHRFLAQKRGHLKAWKNHFDFLITYSSVVIYGAIILRIISNRKILYYVKAVCKE